MISGAAERAASEAAAKEAELLLEKKMVDQAVEEAMSFRQGQID